MVSKSYQFSRHVLGIRTNSEKAGQWLTDTFGDYELVGEETDPYFQMIHAQWGAGLRRVFAELPGPDWT